MSELKRFAGAIAALIVLVVAVGVWQYTKPVTAPADDLTPQLFHFEKEDLVGIKVERPDRTIEMVEKDGQWSVVGEPWKPSRSMVRRVAHQIHDLEARAVVADGGSTDFDLYGLGKDAITVTLTMKDGSTVQFQAGDPNPTSVSFYIRPLPGDTVYVVKKSALDYYRLTLEEFRERRFAWLDADDASKIEADVDGRHLAFTRTSAPDAERKDQTWQMTSPVTQAASLEQIRTMLGRTGALKADSFVEDQPTKEHLAKYGLEPPKAHVVITLGSGEVITLRVGEPIPSTDPPQRYVYRDEDDAVYGARDGFLEAFQLPTVKYRKTDILGKHEWDVKTMLVKSQGQEVQVARTSDDWRWPDDAPIPGSTPARLAGAAAEVNALGFHDPPDVPKDAGMEAPYATILLTFDGAQRTVTVGNELTGKADDGTDQKRRYVQVDGDPTIYEVDAQIASITDDLFREYGRKKERDADKKVREAAGLPPEEEDETHPDADADEAPPQPPGAPGGPPGMPPLRGRPGAPGGPPTLPPKQP